MADKGTLKNKHLSNNSNPDFDLDKYIDEQIRAEEANARPKQQKPKTSFKRNAIAILVFGILPIIWFLSKSPLSIFNFNGRTIPAIESKNVEVPEINIPDINIPDIQLPEPPKPPAYSDQYLYYLEEINTTGLSNYFSGSATQALYNSNTPIEYLIQLREAGLLDKFSYLAIIGLYNGGVTIDYLNSLKAGGFLDTFSYPAIIGLYNGGVPVSFIQELENRDLLKNMNYSDIISVHNANN